MNKTITLLEENIGEKLHDIDIGSSDFLSMTPKAQATKGKVDELDFNIKNFLQIKYLIRD